MNYITTDELSSTSEAIWHRLAAGEEFVVTRAGQPIALLVRTDAEMVQAQLRAHRLTRFGEVVRRIQADAVASGADQITDDEIQAEINAVRAARARDAGR